jgi:4-alpha-glucanotransferase
MLTKRGSGILMHITSLPGKYGIGDFGPQACRFADFLKSAGQGYWQVLPLNPVGAIYHGSPYSGLSAMALNTLLISPELLQQEGLLTQEELRATAVDDGPVDYAAVTKQKTALLLKAVQRFVAGAKDARFEQFRQEQKGWLDDFALFVALHEAFGGQEWGDWPKELRDRQPDAVRKARQEYSDVITSQEVLQYFAASQWRALKNYCNEKGVKIVGDIPIYVVYNSADVWSHPELFKLDRAKKPAAVAGVPPDAFSKFGQLWGMPVYDWDAAKKDGYQWWLARLAANLRLFDIVRLDHFRGFAGYWEVPAGDETAVSGKWVTGPGEDFLSAVLTHIESPALIAEDLGIITPDVRELINKFRLPSMKVLLFAFEEGNRSSLFLPHNHMPNSVVYTGTHDNNTVRGWYEKDSTKGDKRRLEDYVGHEMTAETVSWEFIRMAMMSSSKLAMTPLQDALALGSEARMNHPGKVRGNWKWRADSRDLSPQLAARFRHLTDIYDRL